MTAIPAASAGVRDMADGSLRITLEFEPRHARDAYALFGSRGTPVAVAALAVGYAAKSEEPEKPKGGPLSKEAAMLCQNPAFHEWVRGLLTPPWKVDGPDDVADFIRQECRVQSRADLDRMDGAGAAFINKIRLPFMRWQLERATA